MLSLGALKDQRMRSFLTAMGIAVGIASVVLLTSLGEGLHRFVMAEFTQFGTNIIAVNPGKTETIGMAGAIINNVRPLTMEDALSLETVPKVEGVIPFVQGNAPVEYEGRIRHTNLFGVGPKVPEVWRIGVAVGRFLPDDDPRTPRAFVAIGSKVRTELFGDINPLGKKVRIGGERYIVSGVMEPKGQMLGFDLDDAVYIPTRRALAMYNRDSLMEIDLLYKEGSDPDKIVKDIKKMLIARHGSEDFTLTTQEQMMKVLGSILNVLTIAVGALGGISLVVGGVGILTIMTIAVHERTTEIGLLRAIGAGRWQILAVFLGEAVALSGLGGLAGLIMGTAGAVLINLFVPAMHTHTPWTYVLLSELTAVLIGLMAGVLPARHAAMLDPIEALRAE
ncbi:MAG: ABC transporter permease [Deltaproteobacteria bacterium]|nr:ABC transporter permease [Deltaproteobacteria bacterium]